MGSAGEGTCDSTAWNPSLGRLSHTSSAPGGTGQRRNGVQECLDGGGVVEAPFLLFSREQGGRYQMSSYFVVACLSGGPPG